MNDERLGIADVGHEREKFQRIDELFAGLVSAFDTEGDERALAVGQVFPGALVVGAGLEAGIVDPIHAGMLLKVAGDSEGILRVALEAQVERLNALQQEECAVWRQSGTCIAQTLNSGFQDEGERTKRFSVGEAVVRRIRRRELLEAA